MLTASSGERVPSKEKGEESWFLWLSWLQGLRGAAALSDSMEVVEERAQKTTGPVWPSASYNLLKVSQDISSKQPSKVNPDFKESTSLKKIMELFCFLLFAF